MGLLADKKGDVDVGEKVGAGIINDQREVGNNASVISDSLSFSIGYHNSAMSKHKKLLKKSSSVIKKCRQGGVGVSAGVCVKRKNISEGETATDGDDVLMEDLDFSGKRLKMSCNDERDGYSLTVAEVGDYQPREEQ